jgi:cystathionine gamma-lyase
VRNRSAALKVDFVNFSDAAALRRAVRSETSMLWFETPSNPLLEIVDIAEVVKVAQECGALTVCDNTFSSPCCQRPLEMGVDIVMHSATKFLNGHSDLLAGIVALSNGMADDLAEQLAFLQNSVGAVLDPVSCSTLLRSLKTLAVRMDRHVENAGKIAEFLDRNRERLGIERLIFPGLADHPGHDIARRQMKGFGSMISFAVSGGQARAAQVAQSLDLFAFAVSLGGVESLIQHPASMTHKVVPPEQREKLGITDNLLRVSVGIENAADLIADLERALAR